MTLYVCRSHPAMKGLTVNGLRRWRGGERVVGSEVVSKQYSGEAV